VLVNKSYNKTSYELFNGRSPAIGFLKPFGYHVMILNTLDHLGKFKEKGDEGYFIGYSLSSKAFRVFNKRTKRVEENLHVEFLENKAIEKGTGPNWLFDIDSLTKSMNCVPVDASTISTNLSDTKDTASQEVKKDVSSLRYIALPNWAHDALLEFSSSKPQDHCSTEVPEGSGNTNPTAFTPNLSADHMETLTVETPIPTVSSPVPTAYSTNSQDSSSDARLISKREQVQRGGRTEFYTTIHQKTDPALLQFYLFLCFLSQVEPKKISDALQDPSWVEAMQEELLQFKIHKDPGYLTKVYKVEKAMYGLHQAPRAWYGTLSKYLLKNGFQRGTINQTLFIRRQRGDFILVQVYMDDIIFGSSNPQLCREFETLMHEKFQMIDKYVGDILKKFGYSNVRSSNTPMDKENPWGKDGTGKDVDLYLYRSMIGSLIYLTASRPDIMVILNWDFWYPKDSPFDLVAYSDSDYGGATQDHKSTTEGCQFFGRRLISWQCKKKTIVATSTTEVEYVATASCCGHSCLIMGTTL
nr:hypothetical protein [Tanacetum cinerariifolium]